MNKFLLTGVTLIPQKVFTNFITVVEINFTNLVQVQTLHNYDIETMSQ